MKNSSKTCVYIGIGHMGFPIFQATRNHFLADGWSVIAVDKDPERLDLIADRDVLKTADVPAKADIVFLGVRPQSFVTAEDLATTATIVVSMMAGITSQTIQQRFSNASVVRIIPNTPCEFGRGDHTIFRQSVWLTSTRDIYIARGAGQRGSSFASRRRGYD